MKEEEGVEDGVEEVKEKGVVEELELLEETLLLIPITSFCKL